MAKKTTTSLRPPSMDERIKNLLKEGPLVALYLSVAISYFKEQIEQMSDEEIKAMFDNLLSPTLVRDSITRIYNRMNLIDDE